MKPTAEEIKRLLDYNAQTGALTWRTRGYPAWDARYAGTVAGATTGGYRQVSVQNKRYPVAHVVWVWMTGAWPKAQIDHVDRDPLNNRFANLREASSALNCANQGVRANNKLGLKGVHYDPTRKKYKAQIQFDRRKKHLGWFTTKEAAAKAYRRAAIILNDDFAPS